MKFNLLSVLVNFALTNVYFDTQKLLFAQITLLYISNKESNVFVLTGYDTLNGKELPENWVKLLHDSGLMIYFNPTTGVATLSRPFIVTPESVKSTTIPIFAIPCLNYRYSKFALKEPLNSKVSYSHSLVYQITVI